MSQTDKGLLTAAMQTGQAVSLGAQAMAKGVSAADSAKIVDSIRSLPPAEFARESKLINDALNSKNPDRALATYAELAPIRQQNPSRVTPDIARNLVMGVGNSRTEASQGREGILSQDTAVRSAKTLAAMPQSEYNRVATLLNDAGKGGANSPKADAQTEQALILKTVAARSERLTNPGFFDRIGMAFGKPASATAEIESYANTIKGRDKEELITKSSVLDLNNDGVDQAIQQRWNDSCAPTTAQATKAEADPIYAWQLHKEAVHSTDSSTDIGKEQKAQLDAHGGKAVPRDTGGGSGVWSEKTLNDITSSSTGRVYDRHEVGNTAAARATACDNMAEQLKKGVDIPIEVAWNGGGAHAMLFSDVRGTGSNQEFLLTDPWNGRTAWVKRDDIVNGNTNYMAGTGRIRTYLD